MAGEGYTGHTNGSSHPFDFKIPAATTSQIGVMTPEQVRQLAATIDAVTNRPESLLFVGTPLNASVEPSGSAIAPFDEMSDAMDFIASSPLSAFRIIYAPKAYADFTIPPNKVIYIDSGLASANGGLTVENITVSGTSNLSPSPPILFKGLNVTTNLNFSGGAATQALFILAENAEIQGTVTTSGAVQPFLVSTGIIDPQTFLQAIHYTGTITLGNNGGFVADGADVANSVTCGLYSATGCNNPTVINCSGATIKFADTEIGNNGGFPYGPPVVTFTDVAGQVLFDLKSAVAFGIAGGNIINGMPSQLGAGPRLMFVDSAFTFQAAKVSSTQHVDIASGGGAGTNDLTIGMVYPAQPTAGKLGLVWPGGFSMPSVGLPIGQYFRSSTGTPVLFGALTPGDRTQLLGVSDGSTFFVNVDGRGEIVP